MSYSLSLLTPASFSFLEIVVVHQGPGFIRLVVSITFPNDGLVLLFMLKDDCVLFQPGVFPINAAVVAPWVVLTLLSLYPL